MPYPAHLECDVVLRDGRTLHVRPVRPEDRDALIAFFRALSPATLHSRFFDMRSPDNAIEFAPAEVDYLHDFGVVGELGGAIIAVAHYFASRRKPCAEVAFTIADHAQGLGIGTKLLEALAAAARENHIERFEAEVLADNRRMLDVFLGTGFDVKSRTSEGTVHVEFPIAPTAAADDLAAMRSQIAAHASMKPLFEPRAIAVVGASRREGSIGGSILQNLRDTGFRGALYAVNRSASEVDGVPSFPRVDAIPGEVDLAIVSVPAADVEDVIDDCVTKGVRAAVVITAGFGETGPEGRELEQRLLEKVRAAGMRMVGPNCMGVLNTDPAVRMHATFAPLWPPSGNVAMSSQSGALGLAVLDYARALNIGFSTFVSVGNKADVSGNDLLQYWAEDPRTDVILLYLESFGNPKKFGDIARRLGRRKPIVAVKAGRSSAGARAASSHTGALATSDAIVDDLFRQSGVIRTNTLEEMFDMAALLANQPVPVGRRVAIMTNAGGPGILAADACEASGLSLPDLAPETVTKLRAILPPAASTGNPVDMIASASAEDYRRVLRVLLDEAAVDAVIVLYIPVMPKDAELVAEAIRDCAAAPNGKTIIASFMSAQGVPSSLRPVPSFAFPERAVKALSRAIAYGEWRRRPVGSVVSFPDIDAAAMRTIVDRRLSQGGGWLDALDVDALLRAAGITTARTELVGTAEEAMEAAMRIGFPAVVKAQGPGLLHKSDAGAVKLALGDETAVYETYAELASRLGDAMTGAIVQEMVVGGVEVMVGAIDDPTFGHVVVYGAGGTLVEILSDVAFRIHPLTDVDVEDMVSEVRYSKVLSGVRGAPPADVRALHSVIERLSALLTICPEIRELDVNPLKVRERGAVVVDARVRVEAAKARKASRRISY